MNEFLTVLVLGIATGSAYAIAAVGLVVTYSTSGIFNFSHGAIGMLAAFAYWQTNEAWGWPVWLSLVAVLAVAAPLFGALIEVTVIRGLQGTSEAVRIVVTVSLLVAMLGIANIVWGGAETRRVLPFFQRSKVSIASVNITYHQLVIVAVALVAGVVLRLLFTKTRAGVAMRAVVDDRSLVRLTGGRPDRSAMLAWALGSTMAALCGVLIASQKVMKPIDLTLLVINAYAAAVIGRLRNLPLTVIGALFVGVVEAAVGWYVPVDLEIGRFNALGLKSVVPAIILATVLVALPQQRLEAVGTRVQRERWQVPTMRLAVFGVGAFVLGCAAVASLVTENDLDLMRSGLWFGLLAMSLVPLTGYGGQISLAQLTFAGIGALVMAEVAPGGNPIGVLVAMVVTACVGALVALPAARLTGIYLALATAAFALICTGLLFNQRELFPGGNRVIPPLDLGVVVVDSDFENIVLLSIVISLTGVFLVWLRNGSYGRRLQALKDSPVACATLGMNITSTKVSVFALSAAIAGAAGALSATTVQGIEYQLLASMPVTMLAVVGGVGSIAGAVLGGVLLGAILSVFELVFATNAVGWFGLFQISMVNVIKLGPGFMGITLGQNPSGMVSEFADLYREVGRENRYLAAAVAGEVVIWGAAASGLLSNWWFTAATLVWLVGVVPSIPRVEEYDRRTAALSQSAAALLTTVLVPWESIDSNGWRVVLAVCIAGTAAVASKLLAASDTDDAEVSPDMAGVGRELNSADVIEAEAAIGLPFGLLSAGTAGGDR